MLLPKGGLTWKSTKARIPPSRVILSFLLRTRFLIYVAIAGVVVLLWHGLRGSAVDMQKYVLFEGSSS